jgi:hypothetical protein
VFFERAHRLRARLDVPELLCQVDWGCEDFDGTISASCGSDVFIVLAPRNVVQRVLRVPGENGRHSRRERNDLELAIPYNAEILRLCHSEEVVIERRILDGGARELAIGSHTLKVFTLLFIYFPEPESLARLMLVLLLTAWRSNGERV